MKRTVRRAGGALAASVILASTLTAVTPTAASADPGFCGVKVSTQGYSGGFLYTGRNKCSSAIKVLAVVGGWKLQCVTIGAQLQYTWWSVKYDAAWHMENC